METHHTYRVEIWDDPPDGGGSIIEVIASSSNFSVSLAACKAAIRERPGKYVVHMNGRNRMTCELAPDPPLPKSPSSATADAGSYADELNDPKWTFASLPEWKTLAVQCKDCSHLAPLNRWDLGRMLGKQTVITSILPKLRCQKCGTRGAGTLKLGMMPR